MLDVTLSPQVNDKAWDVLDKRVETPPESEFCVIHQVDEAAMANTRRCRLRHPLLGRAAMRSQRMQDGTNITTGIQTIDISAMGIGFYSPVLLFPKQVVTIFAENCSKLDLRISRCSRVQDDCFLCGATFAKGPMSPGEFSRLIDEMLG